jgi:hypothetical protein
VRDLDVVGQFLDQLRQQQQDTGDKVLAPNQGGV